MKEEKTKESKSLDGANCNDDVVVVGFSNPTMKPNKM